MQPIAAKVLFIPIDIQYFNSSSSLFSMIEFQMLGNQNPLLIKLKYWIEAHMDIVKKN